MELFGVKALFIFNSIGALHSLTASTATNSPPSPSTALDPHSPSSASMILASPPSQMMVQAVRVVALVGGILATVMMIDGVEKWSFFLSCIRKELEPMKSLASAACWVFGFYWFFVGGQAAIEDCPDLLWVMMDFVAYDLYCTYFYIGMAGVVFFALLCIILILALPCANATRFREGASEEDIRSLPKYRFSQSNSLMMIDDNMESNGSHTSEISLHPDDSECCICLCTYDDGTELYRLPCTHHFHCECISQWLRTKAICPICTLSIRGSSNVASE